MKFLKHCLVFVLIKSGVSYGQIVDIQSEVNKKVENGFSAVAMASWDRRTGSSDLSAATGSFLGRYRSDEHLLLAIYNEEFGKKSGVKFQESRFQHLRYRYDFTSLLAGEVFAQEDFDRFRGYSSRRLFGAGPLLRLVDTKRRVLYTGLAYMKEYETLTQENALSNGDTKKETSRASFSVAYLENLSETASINASIYYQPSLESDDARSSVSIGAAFSLTDRLSYVFSGIWTKDTDPPLGIAQSELATKNGLKFVF